MATTFDYDEEAAPTTSPTIAKLRGAGKEVGEAVFGETPSEWALNAALGPVGKAARLGLLGASAVAYSPESEAVLSRLTTQIPRRLEKLYEIAKQLRKEKRGSEVWGETNSKLTLSPAGDIEAIHRPMATSIHALKPGREMDFSSIVDAPMMISENPQL